MTKIFRTILGDIPVKDYGAWHPHDHFFRDWTPFPRTPESALKIVSEICLQNLSDLKKYGVGVYMDVLPILKEGWDSEKNKPIHEKRLIELRREISEKSGVHVIIATGFKGENDLPFWIYHASIADIAKLFSSELTKGIGPTNVRAGVIKLGCSHRMTGNEKKVYLAGAKACLETGAAITTHSGFNTKEYGTCDPNSSSLMDQAELLLDADVPPEKITLGHADFPYDLDYQSHILDMGISLLYSCWGLFRPVFNQTVEDENKLYEMVTQLVQQGYEKQILISTDWAGMIIEWGISIYNWHNPGREPYASGGPVYLWKTVIPRLLDMGSSEKAIRQITRKNPSSIYALEG